MHDIIAEEEILNADVEHLYLKMINECELVAQIKNIKDIAENVSTSGQAFSPDFHIILSKMHDPEKIADFILISS